jgi:hypothetical protein
MDTSSAIAAEEWQFCQLPLTAGDGNPDHESRPKQRGRKQKPESRLII